MIQARRSVQALSPYSPPLEGRRGAVRLDFNENTAGGKRPPVLLPADTVAAYPEYREFTARLAEHLDLPEENLLLVNGSGEALFAVSFAFIEPDRDRALTSRPTFSLIPHNLALVGAALTEVDVTEDLSFDVDEIETALDKGVKLAVFASPDNPTGAVLDPDRIEAWCMRYPDTLFLLDEAYAEYAPATLLPRVLNLTNLLVLRTFSKAWGMAGLRLGVLAGPKDLLDELRKVRCPYSVNAAAVAQAGTLLEEPSRIEEEARAALSRKGDLVRAVEERGYRTRAGEANFFLFYPGRDADALTEYSRQQGVLLRNRSALPGLSGAVRVTVGTQEENGRFLDVLDGFRKDRGLIFDLDDTLVDTSKSYDRVVMDLVARHGGGTISPKDLTALRAEGGFNDDWDAVQALLARRNIPVSREIIVQEGKDLYLSRARQEEVLLLPRSVLERLSGRFRLFLYTGRPRDEFEPVWGEELAPLFDVVLCVDDLPDLPAKPAPDQLKALCRTRGIAGGAYVGNSVDDMRAARAAGLDAIGVATTQPRDVLRSAGADAVLTTPSDIEKEFGS